MGNKHKNITETSNLVAINTSFMDVRELSGDEIGA